MAMQKLTFTAYAVVEANNPQGDQGEDWFAIAAAQSMEDAEKIATAFNALDDGYEYRARNNSAD